MIAMVRFDYRSYCGINTFYFWSEFQSLKFCRHHKTNNRQGRLKPREKHMRDLNGKRFGFHEVKKGKFKGSLHVAPKCYKDFFSELNYLHDYLQRRVLPSEPEEILVRGILLDLQNIIEHEIEKLIEYYVQGNPTTRNQIFEKQIKNGFVSFKNKFEWLRSRNLLTDQERDIMEGIRILRNANIHARPQGKRLKSKYFGKPLLTRTSIRKMFLDVEKVLQKLRSQSGKKSTWGTVPPGYATEMKWPDEAIKIFDGN